MRRTIVAMAMTLSLAVAACGGEPDGSASPSPETPEPTETTPTEEPDGQAPEITAPAGAAGTGFDTEEVELPADAEVELAFNNQDPGVTHNWAFYTEQGGEQLFAGEIVTGPANVTYTFTTPAEGDYWFQCDVHPTTMNGELEVG